VAQHHAALSCRCTERFVHMLPNDSDSLQDDSGRSSHRRGLKYTAWESPNSVHVDSLCPIENRCAGWLIMHSGPMGANRSGQATQHPTTTGPIHDQNPDTAFDAIKVSPQSTFIRVDPFLFEQSRKALMPLPPRAPTTVGVAQCSDCRSDCL